MKQYEKPELKTIYDAAYAANCTAGTIVVGDCTAGSNPGGGCTAGLVPLLVCSAGGALIV